jgi:hypothetical protein
MLAEFPVLKGHYLWGSGALGLWVSMQTVQRGSPSQACKPIIPATAGNPRPKRAGASILAGLRHSIFGFLSLFDLLHSDFVRMCENVHSKKFGGTPIFAQKRTFPHIYAHFRPR